MIPEFAQLRADVAMLKKTIGQLAQVGTVHAIDPVKGYRLNLGDGPDGPHLSPWYPHPETGKTSVPLKVGQIACGINPTGSASKGFLLRGGYSDAHATPNADMAANVFEDAGVKVTIAAGKLIVKTGATTLTIGPNEVTLVTPKFAVNP